MTSGGRIFNEHFFFSNKFVQLILGLRPDHSQKDQLFTLCAIMFYLLPVLILQFYQLFTSGEQLQSVNGVLQKLMGTLVLLTAYSTTYFSFLTMKLLLSYSKAFCEQVSSEEELSFLEENIKQSKLYAYIILGLFNCYGFSVVTPCIVKLCLYFLGTLDDNNLPLIIPVDITKAGVHYFCLFIYQITAFIIILTLGGVSFSAFLLTVLFASYQFRVLIIKIRRPFERNLKYKGNDCYFRSSQEELDWIIDIINRSRKITEYIDLLNNFSKISYLVTIIFGMSLITFDFIYIFQFSMDSQNAAMIIECISYIAGSILTLYLNFYFGQELMNYSDIVFEELCFIPFYTLSNKVQKFLLFMILKSCKQSILSIGGMFVSSHETFAAIMRKAFSFAMVYYSAL